MSNIDKEILSAAMALLRKHDYVTIFQAVEDGCIVTYPHPKLLPGGNDQPRLITTVAIQRGLVPGFYVSNSRDAQERFIAIPEYVMRLYLSYDVVLTNKRIPVYPGLTVYLDESGAEHDELSAVVREPSTEEEHKKEGFLMGLILAACQDDYEFGKYQEVANTHEVGEGYKLLQQLWQT